MHRKSIAFVIRDPLPPIRADVLTLFGTEMPRYGIGTDLIGQGAAGSWSAGAMHPVGSLTHRLASVLSPFWDAVGLARASRRSPLDCIQVRDKIGSGLVGRLAAAMLGVPFVYWMSFPIVEGFEVRRDEIGRRNRGVLWLAHAARAALSRFVIYRMVLPGARHIFVQSDAMADWLAAKGFERARMTAVPMGVDGALFQREAVAPSTDPRLDGRRVIVYLGRIAQSRKSGFLLDVVETLRVCEPGILLVIAGDAPSADEMAWMRSSISKRGLDHHVILTGWLPQQAALGYAVRAEVGLSPIPRGVLFDVSSPTKLVEYLALGIPGVANDIPDQERVIAESGAGLCVPMEAAAFRDGVLELLGNPTMAAQFAARGPGWARANRTYTVLAANVAAAYRRILPDRIMKKVPRVLMVGTDLSGKGGIAAAVSVLDKDGLFEREGVRYLATHADGARARKARVALAGFWRTALACLTGRPAIVHAHSASHASFFRKSLVLLIARRCGARTVFHLHGGGFRDFATKESGPLMRWWIRHTLEGSSAVIALSHGWATFVGGFAPMARVRVVPNSVDVASLSSSLVEEPGRILFLGRADTPKGVYDLLAAVAALAPAYPHVRLAVAGDGDLALLRTRAAQLGIEERLEVLGWIGAQDKADQLARASVFCLPSHAEGLPMAMLEAMAVGKAVVVSRVGGIPEAVADGDNGLLVPPRDVQALAAALSRLLSDDVLRCRMGERARQTVAERYSVAVVGDRLAGVYRELCDGEA